MYVVIGGDRIKALYLKRFYVKKVTEDVVDWTDVKKATVFSSEEEVDNWLKERRYWADLYDVQKAKINPLNYT